MRQVHDANLSDIEEDDKDDHVSTSHRAPGKENDARAGLLKSKEATSSMLKNRSFKTKTDSDTSSDGKVTIKKLKEMHLEADKTVNFGSKAGDGGARISAGSSYKPPSVESEPGCSSTIGGDVKTYHLSYREGGNLAPASGNGDCEMKDAGPYTADKACQADINSGIRVFPSGPDTAASPMDVYQSDSGSRANTCGTDGSGVSCKFPSGTSRTSAASMRFRARRNPAETSTGSPPERDGLAVDENIGDKVRYEAFGSGSWAQQAAHSSAHEQPLQGTFGGAHQSGSMAGGYGNGQKLTDLPVPPTPSHESNWPYTQQQYSSADQYMVNHRDWAAQSSPPSASSAYHHNMGPPKSAGYAAHYGAGGSGVGTGAQYTAQSSYSSRPQNGFNSAAHFSDAHCRRDFSGESYYDHGNEDQYGYSRPSYQDSAFAQTQQSYHDGHQYGRGPQSRYGTQAQYNNQSGSWAEYNGQGFSQQGQTFGDDSGHSAPKEFDFSFLGQGNSASDNYVPTQEEINAYTQRNCMGSGSGPSPQTKTRTPRAESQWTIYEDDDATRNQQRWGDPTVGAYAWSDGKTSVHHVGSSTPGNTVTILSIREITSDEDLSAKFGGNWDDDDDGTFLKS